MSRARATTDGTGKDPSKQVKAERAAGAPELAEDKKKQATAADGAGKTKSAKRTPGTDPKFRSLKADVAAKKRAVATGHPPASVEATSAQAASVPPKDDQEARGKAAHAEEMDAAQPKDFDKAAFVKAVEEAIARKAPQNLEEADEFGDSGKAEEVKTEVQGKVGEGKQASAQEIETTTKAPPEPAKDAKPVTPMTPDRPPARPAAPDPALAAPDRLPPSATDMSDGPEQVAGQMAEADVTKKQLSLPNSREPSFGNAVAETGRMEKHSAAAPDALRASEAGEIKEVKAAAAQNGRSAMGEMSGRRSAAGQRVGTGKSAAKSADEKKRADVTARLQTVFDGTKRDVERTLDDLDKRVDDEFTRGERDARRDFEHEHKVGMARYKRERYSGWDGPMKWGWDKLTSLPEEANRIYERARDNYLRAMKKVISRIGDIVEAGLRAAKAQITAGKATLDATVKALPADLRAIGVEAAGAFADRFSEMEDSVNEKGNELVQTVADRYTEAVKSVDDEIAKEKEKNKGLVARAVDLVKSVIDTIIQIKNVLLGILAKAAQAIGAILRDPIGFLKNLIAAVGGGLRLFMRNIGRHMQAGVLQWLLGTASSAGLHLPSKFDTQGIVQVLAMLLGLTWANIRGRITRKVPERAVRAAETSVPIVSSVKRQGVNGMWSELRGRVGDLKNDLISKVVRYLTPTIIIAGITWILSLFNPASAFIRACKMIIDIIRFIVTQGRQILEFVNTVLDAVIAIARGGSGGVAQLVERALARSIPVLIGALAAILGIGGIAGKVKGIFQAMARPVNRAVDRVIDKIVALLRKLTPKKPGRKRRHRPGRPGSRPKRSDNSPDGQRRRLRAAVAAGVAAVNRYRGRPVAGRILEPLLAVIRIRYGLNVLRPVVQGNRWMVYGRINPDLGSPTGAVPEGMAQTGANPNFTRDARAFERKLAAGAAGHSHTRRGMQTMAMAAKEYISILAGGGLDAWDRTNVRLADLLRRIGDSDPASSGAVGHEVHDLMAVFDEGTLSERFTHIVRFFTNILGQDIAVSPAAEVEARIAQARLNKTFLEAQFADLRALQLDTIDRSEIRAALTKAIAPVSRKSEVKEQGASRVRRRPSRDRTIGVRLADTGLEMSPREEALQRIGLPGWNRYEHVLQWNAGSRVWRARNRNQWVKAKRTLGLPFGAGPSGTTNTMMSAAEALNAGKYDARLACIGFLVGARHHSLVEVMVAAVPFGCTDYREGQQMYRHIEPFSTDELKSFGNGRFPDEPAPGKK